jgi:hypothetical protein
MAIRNMQPGNRPDNEIKYYAHKTEKNNLWSLFSLFSICGCHYLEFALSHDVPLLWSPTPRLITRVPSLINQRRSTFGRRPDLALLLVLCAKAGISEWEASGTGIKPQRCQCSSSSRGWRSPSDFALLHVSTQTMCTRGTSWSFS